MVSPKKKAGALVRRLAVALLVIAALILGYWLGGGSPATSESAPQKESAASETTWTCSMHPQVRQPDPGDCPICGMALIPLEEDGGADEHTSPRTFTTTEASRALMKIETVPVVRRFVEAPVRMVGKVAYDETRLGYITAWVPGRIERLYADYTGVQVNRGDHMVDLYSPELITAKEELRRARQALDRMPSGAPDVLRETAQATLTAVRNRLQRWGMTKSQIDQAEASGSVSDNITVYAPMGGTVIERNGQEGMYVETGTPIYTIADLSRMWVLLDAYESDLPWLKYGERVTFTTEAFPGETFEGRIAFIDPFVDPRTRTVKVRVNVENPEGKLKADMFVRATAHPKVAQGGRVMDPALAGKWISPMHPEIVKDGPGTCDVCGMALVPAEKLGYVSVDAEAQPFVIPASAALVTGKRAVVYVEVPDTEKPTYEGREIVLGPRAGDHYIVRAGVEEGERIVTAGNFKIDSALQIQAKPSMMTPDGGGAQDETKAPLAPDAREALVNLWNYRDTFAAALEDSDLTGAQQALTELRGVIADFQADLIPTAHVATWTEYSRRITNETVEGLNVEDTEALGPVMRSLDHNLGILAERFGYDPEMQKPLDEAIPHAFREALGKVYSAYLDVQRGLAGDDAEGVRAGAQKLAETIETMPADSLGSAATVRWIPLYDTMLAGARAMAEASDLDTQRVPFEDVSESLATAVRTFGIMTDTPVFEVHCPMAFDFEGANWLQDSEDILNPYFGDEMLTCGTVVGPLTGSSDSAPMDHAGHEGHNHE